MNGLTVKLGNAQRVQVVPTGETCFKVDFENGERTDQAVRLDDGRPVFSFTAAVAIDCARLDSVQVESPLRVSAKDHHSARAVVVAEGLKIVGSE